MKKYCSKGHATEYSLNEPGFCGRCGESYGSVKMNRKVMTRIDEEERETQRDEEFCDVDQLDLDRSDVEIEINEAQQRILERQRNNLTVADVFESPTLNIDVRPKQKRRGRKASRQSVIDQTLEQLSKEAGSVKKSNKSHSISR